MLSTLGPSNMAIDMDEMRSQRNKYIYSLFNLILLCGASKKTLPPSALSEQHGLSSLCTELHSAYTCMLHVWYACDWDKHLQSIGPHFPIDHASVAFTWAHPNNLYLDTVWQYLPPCIAFRNIFAEHPNMKVMLVCMYVCQGGSDCHRVSLTWQHLLGHPRTSRTWRQW